MQQPIPEQQPAVYPSATEKHTEANQPRRIFVSNLVQRLPTHAQEYSSVTIIPGEIVSMNMRIYRITEIYYKTALSDTDNIYFHQAMKENDATRFLKAAHKEFA